MASKIIKGEDFSNESVINERPRVVPSAGGRPPNRPGVVDSEVFEAHQKAKEIIAEAEKQAAQIVEDAKRKRDGVFTAAKVDGHEKGLAQATEIVLRAKQEATEIVAAAEPQIVELALVVAEKVVGRALQTDPNLVLNIVAQAIESVRHQRELVIRVHPEDAARLREGRKELMDLIGRTKEIAVREDAEVKQGGCVVETEHGVVDAQLKTQFEMLEDVLLGPKKKD